MINLDVQYTRANFYLDAKLNIGNGITAIFGPSGSGKSTLLNIIAGLISPEKGYIKLGAQPLFDSAVKLNLAPHQRAIGYVFQDSLLFPHLSVKQNLLYGFRLGATEPTSIINFLGLENLLERRPATLSVGERQRVAIGRALLSAPQLLLMDEPLASLDQDRKNEILPYIKQLPEKFGVPVIYVTHSTEEISKLTAQTIKISAGKVI